MVIVVGRARCLVREILLAKTLVKYSGGGILGKMILDDKKSSKKRPNERQTSVTSKTPHTQRRNRGSTVIGGDEGYGLG